MAAQKFIKRGIMLLLCISTSAVLFHAWNTSGYTQLHKRVFTSLDLSDQRAARLRDARSSEEEPVEDQERYRQHISHKDQPRHHSDAEKQVVEHRPEGDGGEKEEPVIGQEEMVRRRFEHRLATLHRACRLYGNSSLFRSKRAGFEKMPLFQPIMNVSVRYCPIAKTAATTWSTFLYSIKDHMRKQGLEGMEDRSKAADEIYFTFVREPYARMLSAYVDKLLTPNTLFWRITGRFIVQRFRHNATEKSMRCGHDVTFTEFVKYIVYSQATGDHLNGHFIPTHDQCDTCKLPYRYIGHLETIKEDMPYIIKAIQSPVNYTKTYDSDTIAQNAKMVLWKARIKDVLKCMDRDEASRRLWRKYQIRGLISKDEAFPYKPENAVNITLEQFTAAALAAYKRSKNKPQLKAQRIEALREAFAQVPLEDRLNAQQTLFLDFQMFGFDPLLEDVFPKTLYVRDENFSYFKIYD